MPSSQRFPVGDVTLAVRTWAALRPSAPDVLLLAGTGATAEDWDVVAPVLAATRTVHAVDLRGHGGSDRPGAYSLALLAGDVARLLDLLPDPALDVVGHSLGGLVACLAVTARPDRVRRLVLEDVGVPHRRDPAPPARPDGPLPFDWAVVEQVRPEIDEPDPAWPSVVAGIAVPTLVVGGGDSSPVPQAHVRELVAALPRGRLETIEAGHLVHEVAPERFTSVVTAFLDAALDG